MKLSDLVEPAQCSADARYVDNDACLDGIARRAASALGSDASAILDVLRHREALGSAGLGAGIALPHTKIAGLAKPYLSFVRLRAAIDFEAVDERTVDIVSLVLLPASGPAGNDIVACAARRLREETILPAGRLIRSKPISSNACTHTRWVQRRPSVMPSVCGCSSKRAPKRARRAAWYNSLSVACRSTRPKPSSPAGRPSLAPFPFLIADPNAWK